MFWSCPGFFFFFVLAGIHTHLISKRVACGHVFPRQVSLTVELTIWCWQGGEGRHWKGFGLNLWFFFSSLFFRQETSITLHSRLPSFQASAVSNMSASITLYQLYYTAVIRTLPELKVTCKEKAFVMSAARWKVTVN